MKKFFSGWWNDIYDEDVGDGNDDGDDDDDDEAEHDADTAKWWPGASVWGFSGPGS